MKTLRAFVITASEATYPKEFGSHVVSMEQLEDGQHTGQSWAVFQGTLEECELLAENMNDGFQFLEKN